MESGALHSVGDILRESADRCANAAAILAPGRPPFTYCALFEQARRVGARLRSLGIAAEDRVALALPNGPDMASGFLSIAAVAGCAPLNPNYRKAEFEFYLADLHASALVLDENGNREAESAAKSLGIPILRTVRGECAGEFDLAATDGNGTGPADWASHYHTALLLHTSGTTARPKLVPLTNANLAASARNIAASLALTPADRCLNIMPLFHVHGLMAAVLATMKAGGSVICTDGVYGVEFFNWMRAFRPTWYTAVPTMHQALAGLAEERADFLREFPLRLIRSSSAALAPQLLGRLESAFFAPVIEAYGMTEAAHQMASNPLPPGVRQPGSVGRATGMEVAIMDEGGQLLGEGAAGEVVIRGENVTRGYEANESANRSAFTNGWFRTGDEGVIDGDGFIRLTGRLKELINRGGQKIAPREIDEVLLAHPSVKQAVAFAIPHAQLGEEVGAAVELSAGEGLEASVLRDWAGSRLAAYKVPRIILKVHEIPKGPTGKVQRIGMAQRLGVLPMDDAERHAAFTPPRNNLEERIAAVWRRMLGRKDIGVLDRFEAVGGDSLLAVGMLATVGAAEGVNLPYLRFLTEGTIESLAKEIETGKTRPPSLLVPVQPRGSRPPLIWFPGHDGLVHRVLRLSAALGEDQPVWALDFAQVRGASTMEELAGTCGRALLDQPALGPWRLAGQCFGAFLAFETAQFLESSGARVDRLILIDALNPAWRGEQKWSVVEAARWNEYRARATYHARMLRSGTNRSRYLYLRDRAAAFFRGRRAEQVPSGVRGRHRAFSNIWKPRQWKGEALIVCEAGRRLGAPAMGWNGVIGQLREEVVPFHRTGPVEGEGVSILKEIMERYLARDRGA
jgi:acyl-CoA synthetase (AMP-forming)/AMP-acid ligase II/thioesterase domain-containing protein